jgi:hypothetical protein
MAAKRLRTESERACDDLAVTSGTHAADYAEHLLDIVTAVRAHATPVVALAMARRKEFEGRMLAILDPELPHTSPSRRQSALLIAGLVLSAGLVAAAAPVPRAPAVASLPANEAIKSVAGHAAPANARATIQSAPASHPLVAQHRSLSLPQTTTMPSGARIRTDPSDMGAGTKLVPRSTTPDPGPRTAADSQSADERPALLAKVLRTESSSELRRVAAWGLQDYDQSSVAEEALVAAVQHDTDTTVREMAAWALASFDGHHDVVSALAAALHTDAAEQVRATAAWALGQAGGADATDALTGALGDANDADRSVARSRSRDAPIGGVGAFSDSRPLHTPRLADGAP